MGNADVESAKADFAEYIDKIERNYIPLDYAKIAFDVPKVKRAEEALDIKQGKLVIGFRADCSPKTPKRPHKCVRFAMFSAAALIQSFLPMCAKNEPLLLLLCKIC